jgi:ABC-type sugar transport system substrate-binding protein
MSPKSRSIVKGVTAAVVLLIAGVLAACGGSDSSSGSDNTAAAAKGDVPAWCGTDKEITLALADGFGDNNWRKITTAEAEQEAALCPSVTDFKYTDGQGDTQKAISDIQSLVAQGVNAMVVFPDAGPAVLPAIRSAYQAGVVTVPYRVSPGGEAGTDYTAYVSTDFTQAGRLWGEWLIKALGDKGGKVLTLGGPPANSQSIDEYKGMGEVIADHPGIQLIGEQPYTATDWDPAKTQQVVTAALSSNPEIDAITTDFGSALASSFPAFQQAGRDIPPIATEDSNLLGCDQKKLGFPLFTVDSQNWMVRTAVQVAVANATGGDVPSTEVPQKPFEDSLTGKPNPVECDSSLSGDAILSSHLNKTDLADALK